MLIQGRFQVPYLQERHKRVSKWSRLPQQATPHRSVFQLRVTLAMFKTASTALRKTCALPAPTTQYLSRMLCSCNRANCEGCISSNCNTCKSGYKLEVREFCIGDDALVAAQSVTVTAAVGVAMASAFVSSMVSSVSITNF